MAAPPTPAVDLLARSVCASCGDTDLVQWLDLGSHPVTNMFPATRAEALAMPRWPIQWLWCDRCGLAQQRYVLPDGMLFGQGYTFRTATSSAPYMRDLAATLSQRHPDGMVVEIGCNDGTLLAEFPERRTVGFDPSIEAAGAAVAGLDVRVEPFILQAAAALRDELGPAGLIIATNVLAHIADPLDMLRGVAQLLDDGGVFVAEVQYLPDLLLGNAYDNLYHEHRFAYSARSLSGLLARAGLRLINWERIEPHGGSLRITAAKTVPTPRFVQPMEPWLMTPPLYAQGHADLLRAKLQAQLEKRLIPVGALGASAKLVTLLNWCDLGDQISWVTDMTPAKWDRYLPGSGVPVRGVAGRPPADLLLVGAWSYLPQILRGDQGYFDGPTYLAGGGHFLVPVPLPTII